MYKMMCTHIDYGSAVQLILIVLEPARYISPLTDWDVGTHIDYGSAVTLILIVLAPAIYIFRNLQTEMYPYWLVTTEVPSHLFYYLYLYVAPGSFHSHPLHTEKIHT